MNTLELGLVTRPHGIRGELKLKLHFEQSTALFDAPWVSVVSAAGESVRFDVLGVRRAGKAVLLRLAGVDTREAAEALRGAKVLIDRSALPPLAPDEYYLADLVGCTVQGPSGVIGDVVEVQAHPSVDSILIKTPAGKLLQQALEDSWIERVSISERLVLLATEDGLID